MMKCCGIVGYVLKLKKSIQCHQLYYRVSVQDLLACARL